WSGERIRRIECRQLLPTNVPKGDGQPRNGTRGSEQWMVDHGESECPRGMQAQGAPIGEDEHEALARNCGEDGEDAEIPDVGGIYAGRAGGTLGEKQGGEHTKGSCGAVGRNEDGTDVEKNWMHVKRIRYSGSASQLASESMGEVRSSATLRAMMPRV